MPKILIVEDHAITREGLRRCFQETDDLSVVGATGDSKTGLTMAAEHNPDLILLDLHLPGKLGPQSLVIEYKKLGAKLVVLSGETRSVIVDLVLQCGADAFVCKSESFETIVQVVHDVLKGISGIKVGTFDEQQARLSEGERHILQMLAQGMKYQDMAAVRGSLAETIRKQVENIQRKLEVETREQLIAWAVANGFGMIDASEEPTDRDVS